MFVIGEKEVNENVVSVRRQGKGDAGQFPVSEIITNLTSEIKNRQAS
jgi:threonyl-tRNA synthetase